MSTATTTLQYVSGDWEWDHDLDCYQVAYAAEVTGWYSGGCYARVRPEVMLAVVARQEFLALTDPDPEAYERLAWDGNGVAVYEDGVEHHWLMPDADGWFELPGWTWAPVGDANVQTRVGTLEVAR